MNDPFVSDVGGYAWLEGYVQRHDTTGGNGTRRYESTLQMEGAVVILHEVRDQFETAGNNCGEIAAYLATADAHTRLRDFPQALLLVQRALYQAERANDTLSRVSCLLNLNRFFRGRELYTEARQQAEQAVLLIEAGRDTFQLMSEYQKLGYALANEGQLDRSLEVLHKALLMEDSSMSRRMQGSGIRESLFDVYMRKRDHVAALQLTNEQLKDSTEWEWFVGLSNMSTVLDSMGDLNGVMHYLQRVMDAPLFDHGATSDALARSASLWLRIGRPGNAERIVRQTLALKGGEELFQIDRRAVYNTLQRALAEQGKWKEAYSFRDQYQHLVDSLEGTAVEQTKVRFQLQHTWGQRMLADSLSPVVDIERTRSAADLDLTRERTRRNIFLFSGLGLLVFGVVVFRQRGRIQKALHRSAELLLNILPAEVADELKDTGSALAKHFDSTTILFTDFKGFTQASEKLNPQDLVAELNTCFAAFDHIVTARGIEKIKTIGDAYMCVGGLPDPKSSSPTAVVDAALEMQAFMIARKMNAMRKAYPLSKCGWAFDRPGGRRHCGCEEIPVRHLGRYGEHGEPHGEQRRGGTGEHQRNDVWTC